MMEKPYSLHIRDLPEEEKPREKLTIFSSEDVGKVETPHRAKTMLSSLKEFIRRVKFWW